MAQNRRRQQMMQRQRTPQLPMSKWDFERIASVARSSNRLHRLRNDRECYFHNCKLMAALMGDEVFSYGETEFAFGKRNQYRDRDGIFNDEQNRPDGREFLSSAGCDDWLQHLKKQKQHDSHKDDWDRVKDGAESYVVTSGYYTLKEIEDSYIKEHGELKPPPKEAEFQWL